MEVELRLRFFLNILSLETSLDSSDSLEEELDSDSLQISSTSWPMLSISSMENDNKGLMVSINFSLDGVLSLLPFPIPELGPSKLHKPFRKLHVFTRSLLSIHKTKHQSSLILSKSLCNKSEHKSNFPCGFADWLDSKANRID